jgi:hypothetical protein
MKKLLNRQIWSSGVYDKIPNREKFSQYYSVKSRIFLFDFCAVRHKMLVEYRYIAFFSCRQVRNVYFLHFT